MTNTSDKALILGLFQKATDADQALNNLSEADFDPAATSVIAADPTVVQQLTDVAGPLSGLSPDDAASGLLALGVAQADCDAYRVALLSGAVCLALTTEADAADSAAEIMTDENGTQVKIYPVSGGAS